MSNERTSVVASFVLPASRTVLEGEDFEHGVNNGDDNRHGKQVWIGFHEGTLDKHSSRIRQRRSTGTFIAS